MKRRDSIKTLLVGGLAGGMAGGLSLPACKTEPGTDPIKALADYRYPGRTEEEQAYIDHLESEQFFDDHELTTIAILCDLILPPNENGGPKEAGVVELIEFMAKDHSRYLEPIRGGLMWLDHESNSRFGKEFKVLSEAEQKQILDEIAYDRPGVEEQPFEVKFFRLMRDHTLTGYYTSEAGIRDLGYKGNQPNIWDGVPQEVLDEHGLEYEPEWLAKCIDQETREEVARWDEEGNLLT